jgi:hypothetical protein
MKICGTHYNAPFVPGAKLTHMWLCERPQGHAGPHASPSHSISLTMASRRFTLDAVVAALPPIEDEEDCPHEHVLKDDDGRDNWFYVCDDCDTVVRLTEPDEDGQSYWEAVE